MQRTEIPISDPFILPVPGTGDYFLFGTTGHTGVEETRLGFDCYLSSDLETWHGPIVAFRPPAGFWATCDYWAPEVQAYEGRYFLFATFKADGRCRGTQVLRADHPQGPYSP